MVKLYDMFAVMLHESRGKQGEGTEEVQQYSFTEATPNFKDMAYMHARRPDEIAQVDAAKVFITDSTPLSGQELQNTSFTKVAAQDLQKLCNAMWSLIETKEAIEVDSVFICRSSSGYGSHNDTTACLCCAKLCAVL